MKRQADEGLVRNNGHCPFQAQRNLAGMILQPGRRYHAMFLGAVRSLSGGVWIIIGTHRIEEVVTFTVHCFPVCISFCTA